MPPRMLAGLPFSRVPVNPERSDCKPASVCVNSPTAINTGCGGGAVWPINAVARLNIKTMRALETSVFLTDGKLLIQLGLFRKIDQLSSRSRRRAEVNIWLK